MSQECGGKEFGNAAFREVFTQFGETADELQGRVLGNTRGRLQSKGAGAVESCCHSDSMAVQEPRRESIERIAGLIDSV